ncbi:MAG: exodeoxyribonuclease VII small subunit [Prevotella sp.]|jgi:exodeoxyribonuclease VII small subunit|nr:exodeoxyribonuclease VII small subunit [Prevotella sp.]MBR0526484.1 exodeoxyribonuclease VII small subunit [Prevotella sp.]MBR3011377.1 exodeoxyribonuclease VII small subunit [Prevotella sp.]
MQQMKYEEAVSRLEEIVKKMENDELDIDQMAQQLKEAQQLIKLCKDRLTKVDADIKAVMDAQQ